MIQREILGKKKQFEQILKGPSEDLMDHCDEKLMPSEIKDKLQNYKKRGIET